MSFFLRSENETTITVGWTPEPTERGTWSIISLCITTLTLCVWTCIHMNIPDPEDMKRPVLKSYRFWSKVGLLIIGATMPELLVWIAWHQRGDATRLAQLVNSVKKPPAARKWYQKISSALRSPFKKRENSSNIALEELVQVPDTDGQKPPMQLEIEQRWTRVHGFFVNMGGLALELTPEFAQCLEQPKTFLFLTEIGFEKLVKLDHNFCDLITVESIHDKDKMDNFMRTLAVGQTFFFCVQCLLRSVSGYPLSLLELMTLSHAVNATLVFCLWWDKPSDVSQSVMIAKDQCGDELFAALCSEGNRTSKEFGFGNWPGGLMTRRQAQLEWESSKRTSNIPWPGHLIWNTSTPGENSTSDQSARLVPQSLTESQATGSFEPGHPIEGTELLFQFDEPTADLDRYGMPQTTRVLSRQEYRLAQCEWNFWKSREGGENARLYYPSSFTKNIKAPPGSSFVSREPPKLQLFPKKEKDSIWISLFIRKKKFIWSLVFGMVLGFISCLGWNATFPSKFECLLWRICSIVFVTGPISVVLAWAHLFIPVPDTLSFFMVLAAYILGRAFLVVEPFISLRGADPGVYQSTPFAAYIPHLG